MKWKWQRNPKIGQQVWTEEDLYINNTAHQFLCAMEYSMRRHMHMDNMREMNDTFR